MQKEDKLTYKTLYIRYLWQSLLFIVVLLVGTFAFYNLEKQYTIYNPTATKDEIILNFARTHNISNDTVRKLLQTIEEFDNQKKPMNVEEAVVYTISVIYTFGWGNILAYSDQSKIFLIFYACLSMPITTAMVITGGKIINKHLVDIIYKLLKFFCRAYPKKSKKLKYYSKIISVPVVLILFATYLTTNALMLVYYENFTYVDSVYYLFVTISTIGFGDLSLKNMVFSDDTVKTVLFQLYNHFSVTIGMGLISAIINGLLSLPEAFKNKIEKRRSLRRLSRSKKISEAIQSNTNTDFKLEEKQDFTYLNNHFYH